MQLISKKKIRWTALLMIVICSLWCVVPQNVFAEDGTANTANSAWPEIAEEPIGRGVVLMERDTGAIIYGKNIDEKLYPASITKIITGLLAVENLNLTDTITFTQEMIDSLPWDAAKQGVVAGETMTVKDCLYSLMLRSNNDIAVAFAYKIAGSEEAFGKMMTERAKAAGATNTNFVNATGLHDDNHYTTARDMALITKEAMSNPTFAEVWGTKEYDLPATNMTEGFTIWHRHNLLVPGRDDYYQYTTGGKTGYTDEAGRTLVTSAQNEGLELISVIMYSSNDYIFDDTKSLMNYGFNNFHKITIKDNEERFGQGSSTGFSVVNRIYGEGTSLFTMGNGSVVIPKSVQLKNIEYVMDMNVADATKGEIAKITYVNDGYALGETMLYVSSVHNDDKSAVSSLEKEQEKVEKTAVEEIFSINIYYIIGAVAVILVLALLICILVKRRRRRHTSRYYR